jgi:predicted nucleic acid-binding protein
LEATPIWRASFVAPGKSIEGWISDLGLTEAAALAYGDIVGASARQGHGMSAPDGMIAAIARVNGGRLATRNLADFVTTGLDLISPWEF